VNERQLDEAASGMRAYRTKRPDLPMFVFVSSNTFLFLKSTSKFVLDVNWQPECVCNGYPQTL
jgi:hypothetical protein